MVVHTQVKLDPKLLERVSGRYEVSGLAVVISPKGDHLLIQEGDEAPMELFPESDLRFFSKTADDVLTFVPHVDGVLLVVSEGVTDRRALEKAKEFLSEMNLIGVVLNRSTERNDSAYY